jgi:hypothetical protein
VTTKERNHTKFGEVVILRECTTEGENKVVNAERTSGLFTLS